MCRKLQPNQRGSPRPKARILSGRPACPSIKFRWFTLGLAWGLLLVWGFGKCAYSHRPVDVGCARKLLCPQSALSRNALKVAQVGDLEPRLWTCGRSAGSGPGWGFRARNLDLGQKRARGPAHPLASPTCALTLRPSPTPFVSPTCVPPPICVPNLRPVCLRMPHICAHLAPRLPPRPTLAERPGKG